jgi:PIN domain nuclease of toxin-antitoxin system
MILLDTHALIFWANEPDSLGENARKTINSASRIGMHIISCFEIAILVEKEKIVLNKPADSWIADALSHPKVEIVPLTVPVAVKCTQLPGNFHRDPADRMLAAECLMNDYPMVTKDRLISQWGYIETIW